MFFIPQCCGRCQELRSNVEEGLVTTTVVVGRTRLLCWIVLCVFIFFVYVLLTSLHVFFILLLCRNCCACCCWHRVAPSAHPGKNPLFGARRNVFSWAFSIDASCRKFVYGWKPFSSPSCGLWYVPHESKNENPKWPSFTYSFWYAFSDRNLRHFSEIRQWRLSKC